MLAALLLHVTVNVTTHMARKALIAMNADSDTEKWGSASPATVSTTQSRRPMSKKRRKNGSSQASAPLLDETFFLEDNPAVFTAQRRVEESCQDDPAASILDLLEASGHKEARVTDKEEDNDKEKEKNKNKDKEADEKKERGVQRDRELEQPSSTSTGWQQIQKLSVDRTATATANSHCPKSLPDLPVSPHNVTRCVLVEEEERLMGYVIRFLLHTGLMVRCEEGTQQL